MKEEYILNLLGFIILLLVVVIIRMAINLIRKRDRLL